ncbi:RNA polymerase sigma factor [Acidicapsa acidisoli]|uniref:RNA polymerase sigma factor n=1 Tax=Acidicapsa acidisoli TaxID=1615681 RepID=UPI0021E0CD5B|nr:sigma-70 family RNA polymerase sigma factor [Acidicapsa acidisoli]
MNLNPIAADPHRPDSGVARRSLHSLIEGSASSHSSENVAMDVAAVERVLAGDVKAFAAIVERWQGPLINMAWRYCHDWVRAEEMAQEAFLRIWRGLGKWRREGSFSTWLFSVAANVYRTELKRIPPVSLSYDQLPERSQPFHAFVQDAELDGAARDEAVRRAVFALPVKYREPLILYYFHEMDLTAASATMGLPEGTMKARLSRAREMLRQRFPQLREQTAGSGARPENGGKR